jgi:hypothetical protein
MAKPIEVEFEGRTFRSQRALARHLAAQLARFSQTEDRDRALACVMTDRALVAGIGHEARGRFCCWRTR